jgi:hypothetical protein
MSDLQFLSAEESLPYILTFFRDPSWHPPSYLFLDANLQMVRLVNWCTVLDDEDAIALLEGIIGAVYIQKKGLDDKYRMLPVKFDLDTNEVITLGKPA